MEDRTDYGKLAFLKAGDLAGRIAALESRKEKETEKYKILQGHTEPGAALAYLTETQLFSVEVKEDGNVSFFFKARVDNTGAAGNCFIHFYAGQSLIAGGLTDIGAGRQEAVFAGGCELEKGVYAVRVRFEGFSGRTLMSADYTVSGYGLAFAEPDNFLSVCTDENGVLYACCCLPDGTCKVTDNSGVSWRTLPFDGLLGKTSLTLTQRGGLKQGYRYIIVQSGALYVMEENFFTRVIEPSGVSAACACPMAGCDGVFNVLYIKNYKAYYTETGTGYFCKPVPVLPSMKFRDCRAVTAAPAPMYILTSADGASVLIEAEVIENGPLTVKTVSVAAEEADI